MGGWTLTPRQPNADLPTPVVGVGGLGLDPDNGTLAGLQ
jgi:hypothetical protein